MTTFTHLSAAAVIATAIAVGTSSAQTPQPSGNQDDRNIEVQTRGPVHEAFADLVAFDPEPGVQISREPPPAIDEIAPDQRPEGNESTWISGYWSFDDDRDDFVWVSGVWRVAPPAHTWVPGYWYRAGNGWRWVQGFWSGDQAAETTEVVYVAAPPENLEAGPSSPPPSDQHVWTSGCWTYVDNRYAWRPGTWIVADPDWVWVPASYRWTPGGYVFIEGHWDYLVDRRGVLYAPVVFRQPQVAYASYRYTPSIAIDLGVLSLHLFSRPRYNHYYFGDYYEPNYWDRGIYPTFAFHMSTYGYDPIYQHRRWEHRRDESAWEASIHLDFNRYRDDERARPRRTYTDQNDFDRNRREGRTAEVVLARPVQELPKQSGSHVRLEQVPDDDRRQIVVADQRRRSATQERVKIENEVASRRSGLKDPETAVEKAKLPVAPIVKRAPAKKLPPASPIRARTESPVAADPKKPGKDEKPAGGRGEVPTPGKPDAKPKERETPEKAPERRTDKPVKDPTPKPTPPKTEPGRKPDPTPVQPGRKPDPTPVQPGRKTDPTPVQPGRKTDPTPVAPGRKTDPTPVAPGKKPEERPAVPKRDPQPVQPGKDQPKTKRRPEPQLPKKADKPSQHPDTQPRPRKPKDDGDSQYESGPLRAATETISDGSVLKFFV